MTVCAHCSTTYLWFLWFYCSVSDLCRASSGFVKSRSSNLGLVRFRQNPSVKSVNISASPPDPPGSWTPNLGTSSVVGAGNLGFVNGSHWQITYCSVDQCRPGKFGYVHFGTFTLPKMPKFGCNQPISGLVYIIRYQYDVWYQYIGHTLTNTVLKLHIIMGL